MLYYLLVKVNIFEGFDMDNRYNRHNRRKYSLKVHIVLVTKYRKQILKGSIADDVKQKICDICNSKGYGIIAMETDKDHQSWLFCSSMYLITVASLICPTVDTKYPLDHNTPHLA